MSSYHAYLRFCIEIIQKRMEAQIYEGTVGDYLSTCINDVTVKPNGVTNCLHGHGTCVSKIEVNLALTELAEVLEETKDHIGAANTFPMWMLSLVGVYDTQFQDHIRYEFVESRKINLCRNCHSKIWGTIATFKEMYPELFIPMIKEPEVE